METEKEFKKVKDIVLEILEKEERSRNDDKYLTWAVMRRFTNIYIDFNDFDKMPAFETIKRVRAHIQNKEGRFKPTDQKVIDKRARRQTQVKNLIVGGL